MELILQLYGFEEVLDKLQDIFKKIPDPIAVLNGDPEEPIFGNVLLSKPTNLSLFGRNMAILLFPNITSVGSQGLRGQNDKAEINGSLFIFVPGEGDESTKLCKRYTDICGALLKNSNILNSDFPGCTLNVPKNNVHDFKVVNVDPSKPKNPMKSTSSLTSLSISKPVGNTYKVTI